jgi:hypothetical protein
MKGGTVTLGIRYGRTALCCGWKLEGAEIQIVLAEHELLDFAHEQQKASNTERRFLRRSLAHRTRFRTWPPGIVRLHAEGAVIGSKQG